MPPRQRYTLTKVGNDQQRRLVTVKSRLVTMPSANTVVASGKVPKPGYLYSALSGRLIRIDGPEFKRMQHAGFEMRGGYMTRDPQFSFVEISSTRSRGGGRVEQITELGTLGGFRGDLLQEGASYTKLHLRLGHKSDWRRALTALSNSLDQTRDKISFRYLDPNVPARSFGGTSLFIPTVARMVTAMKEAAATISTHSDYRYDEPASASSFDINDLLGQIIEVHVVRPSDNAGCSLKHVTCISKLPRSADYELMVQALNPSSRNNNCGMCCLSQLAKVVHKGILVDGSCSTNNVFFEHLRKHRYERLRRELIHELGQDGLRFLAEDNNVSEAVAKALCKFHHTQACSDADSVERERAKVAMRKVIAENCLTQEQVHRIINKQDMPLSARDLDVIAKACGLTVTFIGFEKQGVMSERGMIIPLFRNLLTGEEVAKIPANSLIIDGFSEHAADKHWFVFQGMLDHAKKCPKCGVWYVKHHEETSCLARNNFVATSGKKCSAYEHMFYDMECRPDKSNGVVLHDTVVIDGKQVEIVRSESFRQVATACWLISLDGSREVFYGIDCVKQMLHWLKDEAACGRRKLIHGFNSSNFDVFFILEWTIKSFPELLRLGRDMMMMKSSILRLIFCGHIFLDVGRYLNGSLAGLCKSFAIPAELCKLSDFELKSVTRGELGLPKRADGRDDIVSSMEICLCREDLSPSGYIEFLDSKPELKEAYLEYCKYDCISLAYLWKSFVEVVDRLKIDLIGQTSGQGVDINFVPTISGAAKRLMELTYKREYDSQHPEEAQQAKRAIENNKKLQLARREAKKKGIDIGIDLVKTDKIVYFWHPDDVTYDRSVKSLRGGASLAEQMGLTRDPSGVVDVSSLYPSGLVFGLYPKGPSEHVDHYIPNVIGMFHLVGIHQKPEVRIHRIPALVNGRVCWGEEACYIADAWLWMEDIDMAVDEGMTFDSCDAGTIWHDWYRPFREYNRILYNAKNAQKRLGKGNMNKPLYEAIKLMLNSVSGRLMMHCEQYNWEAKDRLVDDSGHYLPEEAMRSLGILDDSPAYLVDNIAVQKQKAKPRENNYSQFGSLMLAYSRTIFHHYLKIVGGSNKEGIIYAETDSISAPIERLCRIKGFRESLSQKARDRYANIEVSEPKCNSRWLMQDGRLFDGDDERPLFQVGEHLGNMVNDYGNEAATMTIVLGKKQYLQGDFINLDDMSKTNRQDKRRWKGLAGRHVTRELYTNLMTNEEGAITIEGIELFQRHGFASGHVGISIGRVTKALKRLQPCYEWANGRIVAAISDAYRKKPSIAHAKTDAQLADMRFREQEREKEVKAEKRRLRNQAMKRVDMIQEAEKVHAIVSAASSAAKIEVIDDSAICQMSKALVDLQSIVTSPLFKPQYKRLIDAFTLIIKNYTANPGLQPAPAARHVIFDELKAALDLYKHSKKQQPSTERKLLDIVKRHENDEFKMDDVHLLCKQLPKFEVEEAKKLKYFPEVVDAIRDFAGSVFLSITTNDEGLNDEGLNDDYDGLNDDYDE